MADTDTGADPAAETTIDPGLDTGAEADAPPPDTAAGLAAAWDKLSADLPITGQPRAADGKFAPKAAETAAAGTEAPAQPAAAAKPGEPPAAAATGAAGDAAKAPELPHYWTPEDKAMALKAPADVRDWMVNRDRMLERAWTAKTQELSELRRPFEQMQQQLGPYMANARSKGYDLMGAAAGLFATEHELQTGSQERKQQIVADIIKSYGIDISGMAAQAAETKPFTDPALEPIQAELAALKQWKADQERGFQSQQQQAQQAEQTRIEREVQQFAAERNPEGQLVRPHMPAVLNEMIAFLSIPGMTLQGAYEKAVRANDQIFAQEQARAAQAAEDKRNAEAKAAAAKARTSAGFQAVRTAGAPAPQPAVKPGLSTHESLSAAWDQLAQAS